MEFKAFKHCPQFIFTLKLAEYTKEAGEGMENCLALSLIYPY